MDKQSHEAQEALVVELGDAKELTQGIPDIVFLEDSQEVPGRKLP